MMDIGPEAALVTKGSQGVNKIELKLVDNGQPRVGVRGPCLGKSFPPSRVS